MRIDQRESTLPANRLRSGRTLHVEPWAKTHEIPKATDYASTIDSEVAEGRW